MSVVSSGDDVICADSGNGNVVIDDDGDDDNVRISDDSVNIAIVAAAADDDDDDVKDKEVTSPSTTTDNEPEWRIRLLNYLKRPESTSLLKALKLLLNILKDKDISLDKKSLACQSFYRDIELDDPGIRECLESYIMTKFYDVLYYFDQELEGLVRDELMGNEEIAVAIVVAVTNPDDGGGDGHSSILDGLKDAVLPADMLDIIQRWIRSMDGGGSNMDFLIPSLLESLKSVYCGSGGGSLFSAIKYIERFRCSSSIIGEASFSLTTVEALFQLITGKGWISPQQQLEQQQQQESHNMSTKFDPIKRFIEFVPRVFGTVSDSFKKEEEPKNNDNNVNVNSIRAKVKKTTYDLLDDSFTLSELRFILNDYKSIIESLNK